MIFTVNLKNANIVRNALVERGWIEKISPKQVNVTRNTASTKFGIQQRLDSLILSNLVKGHNSSIIWDLKHYKYPKNLCQDVPSTKNNIQGNVTMEKKPIRNQLDVEALWTSQQGLWNCTQQSSWSYIENVSGINTPRIYINTANNQKDFLKDYLLTACTSLLKWVLTMVANNVPIINGKISTNVLVFALNRCKEYLYMKQNRDIDFPIHSKATSGQWNFFLKSYYTLIDYHDAFVVDSNNILPLLIAYAKILLKKIHKYRPQLSCEGLHNIWIMKSADPRVRDIKLASKLDAIIAWINCAPSGYVIQKYIGKKLFISPKLYLLQLCLLTNFKLDNYFSEEPMLIHKTKFDIRQYYLITSVYPLEIWMYKKCYLRFSSQNYTLKNFHASIHQTNNKGKRNNENSCGRHYEVPMHNVWSLHKFKKYLQKVVNGQVWETIIYPGMKQAIVGIMLSSQTSLPFPHDFSKRSFGLYGCDFVLDKEYRPWLIEIKSCPDLNPTTTVTSIFCERFIRDVFKGKQL